MHPLLPDTAEIGQQRQALGLIRKAALVDQHAAIDIAGQDRVFDLIEAHHDGFELPQLPQQQRRGGALARNRHTPAYVALRCRDNNRPDAEAGGPAGAQQDVTIAKAMAVGVDRHLGDLRVGTGRANIQRFDVVQVRQYCGPGTSPCTSAWKAKVSLGHGEKAKLNGAHGISVQGLRA